MSGSVLVLGGGPDRERGVSLESAAAVGRALRNAGFEVHERTIDRIHPGALAALPGDLVFPALHGAWGEGGPLQELLVLDGRPFVGCGPSAARLGMDKIASKLLAARLGVPTEPAAVLNPQDPSCPLPFPVVVKPIFEGSSVGLHICEGEVQWRRARVEADRPTMVERLVEAPRREIAVGVLDGRTLPIVEIAPAEGVYDFAAKYERSDTRYVVRPDLPGDASERAEKWALDIAREMGASALCRVDFLIPPDGAPRFLEINTLPGFTEHSLYPMAASASGLEMPALCRTLVERARASTGAIGA